MARARAWAGSYSHFSRLTQSPSFVLSPFLAHLQATLQHLLWELTPSRRRWVGAWAPPTSGPVLTRCVH